MIFLNFSNIDLSRSLMVAKLLEYGSLEGTARYAGLLRAPPEGFGL